MEHPVRAKPLPKLVRAAALPAACVAAFGAIVLMVLGLEPPSRIGAACIAAGCALQLGTALALLSGRVGDRAAQRLVVPCLAGVALTLAGVLLQLDGLFA